jgi:hypothetical protein
VVEKRKRSSIREEKREIKKKIKAKLFVDAVRLDGGLLMFNAVYAKNA